MVGDPNGKNVAVGANAAVLEKAAAGEEVAAEGDETADVGRADAAEGEHALDGDGIGAGELALEPAREKKLAAEGWLCFGSILGEMPLLINLTVSFARAEVMALCHESAPSVLAPYAQLGIRLRLSPLTWSLNMLTSTVLEVAESGKLTVRLKSSPRSTLLQ